MPLYGGVGAKSSLKLAWVHIAVEQGTDAYGGKPVRVNHNKKEQQENTRHRGFRAVPRCYLLPEIEYNILRTALLLFLLLALRSTGLG